MTKISIITPTYNAESTLRNNLKSIASQSVVPEHFVVDGGSCDQTMKILNANVDNPSRVISEPDEGIYDAMNKGIRNITGEIVGILNADDFYASSSVLKKVINVFQNPLVDACYGDLCYVDHEDTDKVVRYWKAGPFNYRKFYWGWMPPHPTFFVRRLVYEKYGDFNLSLGSAADYELMLRFLVRYRLNAVYIPDVLVKMRTGGVSNSGVINRYRANRMDRKAWAENDLHPYPWTIILKPLRKLNQWFVHAPENDG